MPTPDSTSTPHDLEAEVRASVHALLRDWLDPAPEATERFLARVTDDFTGHGTGPGDYYADRDALRAMVQREHEGMAYPFTLDVPWMTVRLPRSDMALAEGALRLEIDTGEEMIVEAPRFTFVLERQPDGRWLLVHFHFSVPDAIQNEGDTMDDIIWTRTRDLERQVAERTAALEQSLADLRAAQDQLVHQEKLASLGQLTAGIAHEIKNPLNFVNNFADMIAELAGDLRTRLAPYLDTLDEADRRDLGELLDDLTTSADKVLTHGQRADRIIKSMLLHARGVEGHRQTVPFNQLVDEYVNLAFHGMRAQHADFNATVERHYDDAMGEIDLVPQEIGRVLLNLLGNAFYAVHQRSLDEPDYEPVVQVCTQHLGETLELRIHDNGPGIPADALAKIFEPFFTTKPTGEGTGLGLSMSYDIVTQGHGGTLRVESAEGEGATFVVQLPAG